MQFVRPYWLLWYLMALIIWNILIPFVETDSPRKKVCIFTGSVLLALAVGYDDNVGYYLSLSRVIVFFPFFLAGFYGRKHGSEIFPQCYANGTQHKKMLRITSAAAALGIAWLLFEYRRGIKVSWLYQSAAYDKWDYNVGIRILSFACATVFLRFLCVCMPNRRIRFITRLGQNTMPVFLLHGFVMRFLKYYPVPALNQYPIIGGMTLIIILLYVLSSEPVRKLCKPLLSYPFGRRRIRQA